MFQQQMGENSAAGAAENVPVPVKLNYGTIYSFNWVNIGQHGYIEDQLGNHYSWKQRNPRMDGGIGFQCDNQFEKRCTAVVRRIVNDDGELMYLERPHISHPKLDSGNVISIFFQFKTCLITVLFF